MKLPPHRKLTCQGINIYGVVETCNEPVDSDSTFPLCAIHLFRLRNMPRRRVCAGALTYDAAFRPVKLECSEATGHEEERLCVTCRVLEKSHEEKFKAEYLDDCPTCGQRRQRGRAPLAVPPKTMAGSPPYGSRQGGGGQTSSNKYPPRSVRPRLESPKPAPTVFNTGTYTAPSEEE